VILQEEESVKVIQDRLAHTSAQMTLDIYSHLWPEDEDRTRAAVDGVLGSARAGSAHAAGESD
jgi:integrase